MTIHCEKETLEVKRIASITPSKDSADDVDVRFDLKGEFDGYGVTIRMKKSDLKGEMLEYLEGAHS